MCVVLRLHWCWLGGGVPELDVAVARYVHEIDEHFHHPPLPLGCRLVVMHASVTFAPQFRHVRWI